MIESLNENTHTRKKDHELTFIIWPGIFRSLQECQPIEMASICGQFWNRPIGMRRH